MTILALDKKCYLAVDSRYTLRNMFRNIKIVAVGDLGVGKTTLLYAMMEDRFFAEVYPIGTIPLRFSEQQ